MLKTLKSPAPIIRYIMKGVCLVLYTNPTEKMKDADGLKMVTDWWAASVKLLNDIKLLEKLQTYDKENIPENVIMKLKEFFEDKKNAEYLDEHSIEKASPVCFAMFKWIQAMYGFYFINKKVKPKKAKLAEASEKEKVQKDALGIKQA